MRRETSDPSDKGKGKVVEDSSREMTSGTSQNIDAMKWQLELEGAPQKSHEMAKGLQRHSKGAKWLRQMWIDAKKTGPSSEGASSLTTEPTSRIDFHTIHGQIESPKSASEGLQQILHSPRRDITPDASLAFSERRFSEVALGKQKEDLSIPLENREDAESAGKRELLQDAQINIWEGHLNEGEVTDLMITGRVISSETLDDGSTQPEKITLDSGIVGVFKANDDDRNPIGYVRRTPEHDRWFGYELEIVAFQMDKKLGLGMVPLTVEREVNGKKGSFQLWVNDLTPSSPMRRLPNNAQFFDFLIHHEDRFDDGEGNGYHNIGYNPNQVPVLYDNDVAFSPAMSTHLTNKDISKLVPDPHILKNAEKLNMEELKDIKDLTPKRKQALLHRRDWLVREVHKYLMQKFKERKGQNDEGH
jgi:hypothetical protein